MSEVHAGSTLWSAQAQMPAVIHDRIVIAWGRGAYVTTTGGDELLDATAGLWHANIGHGREELAQAAFDQMRKLETYHIFGKFANDRALALSDRLAGYAPFPRAKVIMTSGGSDAVDTACKLARRHWQLEGRPGKTAVISRNYAYHGLHGYGTSIAGLDFNREGYGSDSLIPETARVAHSSASELADAIERMGADSIAAFVAEPVMGTGGVIPPAPGYFDEVMRLCKQHDILFIADEVITGFGRVGAMFASERFGLEPDMVLFAKGVTSGYLPLGGILVGERIWQRFWTGDDAPILRQGATYAGHATASAVAEANLDVLENESLIEAVRSLEPTLASAVGSLSGEEGVQEIRCAGLMAGVQLQEWVDSERLFDDAIEAGVILRILRGKTVQISPPFVITESELLRITDTIRTAVASQAARRSR